MPFVSEKQRKFLWAKKPKLAHKWTKKYGSKIAKGKPKGKRKNLWMEK